MDNPGKEIIVQCVFWDQNADEGFGAWSEQGSEEGSGDGCDLVEGSGETGADIKCECNHLSTFSVVLVSSRD